MNREVFEPDQIPPDGVAIRAVGFIFGEIVDRSVGPRKRIFRKIIHPTTPVRQEHVVFYDEREGDYGVCDYSPANGILEQDLLQVDEDSPLFQALPQDVQKQIRAAGMSNMRRYYDVEGIRAAQNRGDLSHKIPKTLRPIGTKLK